MKRLFISILFLSFLFISCWIEPKVDDYKKEDNQWYFYDYETMRTIMVAEINKTYKDWHWSPDVFDQKYSHYKHNTDLNTELYEALQASDYDYYVKYDHSYSNVPYYSDNKKKYIRDDYFLFIEKDGDTLVFFQN